MMRLLKSNLKPSENCSGPHPNLLLFEQKLNLIGTTIAANPQ